MWKTVMKKWIIYLFKNLAVSNCQDIKRLNVACKHTQADTAAVTLIEECPHLMFYKCPEVS